MPEFVYHLPSMVLFILLNLILISISFLFIALLRRHLPLHFRYQENTAIVSCSAFLGVTYAILIGFTVLYQLSSFDKAEVAEEAEGKALYTIYRNARDLPAPSGNKIRALVKAYALNALEREWPALTSGRKIDSTGKNIIEVIMKEINDLIVSKNPKNALTTNALYNLSLSANTLFELHQARTAKSHASLGTAVWFVLFFATAVTLAINYLLGMEFRLHLACISLICGMIAAILYLLIGLDRPYQGDYFVVSPEALQSTLDYINEQT